MNTRRGFLRGLLGAALAAPFVGIAKAAGYKAKRPGLSKYALVGPQGFVVTLPEPIRWMKTVDDVLYFGCDHSIWVIGEPGEKPRRVDKAMGHLVT